MIAKIFGLLMIVVGLLGLGYGIGFDRGQKSMVVPADTTKKVNVRKLPAPVEKIEAPAKLSKTTYSHGVTKKNSDSLNSVDGRARVPNLRTEISTDTGLVAHLDTVLVINDSLKLKGKLALDYLFTPNLFIIDWRPDSIPVIVEKYYYPVITPAPLKWWNKPETVIPATAVIVTAIILYASHR